MSKKIFPDESWAIAYYGICWKRGAYYLAQRYRCPFFPMSHPLQGWSSRHFSDREIQRQEQRSWMCDSTKSGIQKIARIFLLCFWSLNQIICKKLHGSGILKTALIYFSLFNSFQQILLRAHFEKVFNCRPTTIIECHQI